VTGPYAVAIQIVALLLAAWALGLVLANRPPGVPLLAGGAVLEALLIGFLVGGLVQMAGSQRHFTRGERTRAGTAVIAAGFLIMPVMVIRVQQVWAGPVG